MNKKQSNQYDVIIIGAGVGGLVSGCYLAKAGLKVLIIEQHFKVGGYCTSFERKGYIFDAGVHYLGSAQRGVIGNLIEELNLNKYLKLLHFDPTEKIIIKKRVTYIRSDPDKTIKEFKKSFPNEKKNIERFFNFVLEKNFFSNIYPKLKNASFEHILDSYFKDKFLKGTLSSLSFVNIGSPATIAPALCSIVLLREYVLDPGHYPLGGIQKFPDSLSECFKEAGGQLLLSNRVERIISEEKKVKGVVLADNTKLYSPIIISNADAFQTFQKFLNFKNEEAKRISKFKLSNPVFAVYLGLKTKLDVFSKNISNVWYFSDYRIEKFLNVKEQILKNKLEYLVCVPISLSQEKSTVSLFIYAPYMSKSFWEDHKLSVAKKMVNLADNLLPNLKKYIDIQVTATPITFYRYTLNEQGACMGWLPYFKNVEFAPIAQKTSIKGLYTAGHWYTREYFPHGGIPNASFSGRRAAKLILNDLNKKWMYKEIIF